MNIPQILKNFLNSEKAIASAVPLIIATVFVFTGKITEQEWMNFAMAITGIYVGGKTIQGTAAVMKSGGSTALAGNDKAADAALANKFDTVEEK